MVLMAIDHAAYFVAQRHPAEYWGLPLPHCDSTLAFLTRFVTHICAPGFFFLLGAGMVLFSESRRGLGWPEGRIARFFALRGGLLILLQLNVENPAWLLGPSDLALGPGGGGDVWLHFGVLYALGAAMIVGIPLLRLATAGLTAVSVAALLLTQFLIPSPDHVAVQYAPLLRLLLIPGHSGIWSVMYPLVPWLGFAGLGMVFGRELAHRPPRAFAWTLAGGVVCLLSFVALRAAGGFGNFHAPAGSSWIDFLNLTKYPPSLVFALLTLGLNLLLLRLFWALGPRLATWGAPLLTFGRTALFFYLIHLYLYAVAGKIVGVWQPEGAGFALMYAVWALGLMALYPLCRAYGRFKQTKAPDSLWRLL
jgi:uncharacterized membrane protein